MADTLPQHYTDEFSSNWIAALGQKKSRLDGLVSRDDFQGERKRYSILGETTSNTITTRKSATVENEVAMDIRWAAMVNKDVTNMLDEWDEARLDELVLPTSDYVDRQAYAFNRDCDISILAAATGNALAGQLGTTNVPLPASQIITEGGSTGMTLLKLRKTLSRLNAADELDTGSMERFFVWTSRQQDELLATTEVASADYNTVRALADGEVKTFMGFKFIMVSNNLLPRVGNIRTCVAIQKGAMRQAVWKKGATIIRRHDLRDTIQIRSTYRIGATRLLDAGVVAVQCFDDGNL